MILNKRRISHVFLFQRPFIDENGNPKIVQNIANYIIEKIDIYLGLNRKFIDVKDQRYNFPDHEEYRYEAGEAGYD